MAIEYRRSKETDEQIIDELLRSRFGDGVAEGALDSLNMRYLLAFDGGTLVGMTGLNESKYYNGAEIDYTCIRKEYEHHGLATKMISIVTSGYNKNIYCSCWRMGDRTEVNLHYAMDTLGFQLVYPEHKVWLSKHNKLCSRCVMRQRGCYCYEDLYVKEAEGADLDSVLANTYASKERSDVSRKVTEETYIITYKSYVDGTRGTTEVKASSGGAALVKFRETHDESVYLVTSCYSKFR